MAPELFSEQPQYHPLPVDAAAAFNRNFLLAAYALTVGFTSIPFPIKTQSFLAPSFTR
jgi:hypothetical protein